VIPDVLKVKYVKSSPFRI